MCGVQSCVGDLLVGFSIVSPLLTSIFEQCELGNWLCVHLFITKHDLAFKSGVEL